MHLLVGYVCAGVRPVRAFGCLHPVICAIGNSAAIPLVDIVTNFENMRNITERGYAALIEQLKRRNQS